MTELTTGVLDVLQAAIGGRVSRPGEVDYGEAVNIWNGAIGRRPAVVVSCTTSGDVASALSFARQQGLEVSVRGGGHNYAGFALTEGGLMIDLTPMKAVCVDADSRRATCGGERRGAKSTPPLRPTVWPFRAASSAGPGSRASPWGVVSDGCRALPACRRTTWSGLRSSPPTDECSMLR